MFGCSASDRRSIRQTAAAADLRQTGDAAAILAMHPQVPVQDLLGFGRF